MSNKTLREGVRNGQIILMRQRYLQTSVRLVFGPPSAKEGAFVRTAALARICAVLLISSGSLLAQQPTTPASESQQTENPSQPPAPRDTAQQPATQQPAGEPAQQPPATLKAPLSPKEEAWQILDTACGGDKTGDHAIAIRVLGLMPGDAKAEKLAEQGLENDKPEIRAAAAAALGDMKSRSSLPKLRALLDDSDPLVALAAAHSLELMRDNSAYEVYYEILTRQRKGGKGMIASQTAILKDPKRMAQLGFEEGIGFIPFAGVGWTAVKAIMKDDSSPVRAAAAKVLANDPDPATTKALAEAAGDKSWLVRAAALEALAKRGDTSVLNKISVHMDDDKTAVKYTAAAAVLRLTAIREGRAAAKATKKNTKSKQN